MAAPRQHKTGLDVAAKPPPENSSSTKARVGFVRSANDQFKALPERVRKQLLRKLKEVALNPSLGKPLVNDLKACRRVTFGRLRCVVRVAEGMAVVLVLVISPRKAGAAEDPYHLATEMMSKGGPQVQELLEHHVRAFLADATSRKLVDTAVSKIVKGSGVS